jgi:hypothetical protein
VLLADAILLVCVMWNGCSRVNSGDKQEAVMTEIFAGTDWYRARPEPEMEWRGVIRHRDVVIGPASRTSVTYTLITNDQKHYPVYAANAEGQLVPYAGRAVIVRAKLVDLRAEGFGEELWIASIAAIKRDAR